MKWIATMLCLLGGCAQGSGGDEDDLESRLRAALPGEAQLAVSFPAGEAAHKPGNGLTGAGYIDTSVNLAKSLNSSLRSVMTPILNALGGTAEARGDSRALWAHDDAGGHTLLVAEEMEDGHVRYQIATRSGNGAWAPLLAGTATLGSRGGQGAVWIDLRHDTSPKTSGRFLVLYDFERDGERSVTLYSYGTTGVDDETAQELAPSRVFHFQGTDTQGTLVYARDALSVRYGPGKPFTVQGDIVTRWNPAGGRTDVVVRGGDLADAGYTEGRGSECWDRPGFHTTYAVAFRTRPGEPEERAGETGDAGGCAFPEFSVPALPSLGDPPPDPELPPEAADTDGVSAR